MVRLTPEKFGAVYKMTNVERELAEAVAAELREEYCAAFDKTFGANRDRPQ